ncbi:hypothetical protein [Tessaracoccus lapidicaptus]|uniref:hypothetical protein n=1 Tax=Tessaracoccus lapidicaptus TaxID=1427523 RepID=UPI003340994C
MVKRVFVDVAIGLGLAIAGQFVQLTASIVGPLLGLPFAYESAPEDGSVPEALLTQIDWMFWLASIGMLLLSFLIGLILRIASVREGATRGAAWVAVVALSQFLLGLGNGVVPVFGLLGVWVYFVAVVLGPVLAGLIGARRRHAVDARRGADS